MEQRRRWARLGARILLALLVACDRKAAVPANVTVQPSAPPQQDSIEPAVASLWRKADGTLLLLAGSDASDGWVVPTGADEPTRGIAQGVRVPAELLGRSGRIAMAVLAPTQSFACDWQRVRVSPADSLVEEVRWTIAMSVGVARGVALDSLERLSRTDSSRLVVDLARLLSGLPDDTVPRFRGLPFAVHGAWLFDVAPGVRGVVAEVHRRVAQEANPLEERLLVLAERDSATGARWRASWWARSQGTELDVGAPEALAVLRFARDPFPTMIAQTDDGVGGWLEVVARDAAGSWRARWRSPPRPECDDR